METKIKNKNKEFKLLMDNLPSIEEATIAVIVVPIIGTVADVVVGVVEAIVVRVVVGVVLVVVGVVVSKITGTVPDSPPLSRSAQTRWLFFSPFFTSIRSNSMALAGAVTRMIF